MVALFCLDETEHRLKQEWRKGRVESRVGRQHLVVAGQAVDRSNGPAQSLTSRMLRAWHPRWLLVVDICGGIRGKGERPRDDVAVGDVVVHSHLHYPEFHKETGGGEIELRNLPFAPPSQPLRDKVNQLIADPDDWLAPVAGGRPGEGTSKLLPGEIVVVEALLSDPASETIETIVNGYPKALAVDMESVGVALAVYDLQQEGIFTQFLVLRAVSDLIDVADNQATRDTWKPYAAKAAAAAALALVKRTPGVDAAEPLPAELSEYLRDLQAELIGYPDPAESFALPIESGDGEIDRNALLGLVANERRSVLVAQAGAGKRALRAFEWLISVRGRHETPAYA